MAKIGFDFETFLITAQAPVPRPVCMSTYNGQQRELQVGIPGMEAVLFSMLTSNELLIAHNIFFEAGVIFKYFPKLQPLMWAAMDDGRLFCTLVYERLLDNIRKKPLQRYGLDVLVKNYLDIDISEDKKDLSSWRYRYSELNDIEKDQWPQEAIQYAINDSVYTVRVYLNQIQEAQLQYKLAVNSGIALNLMGKVGISIDKSRLSLLKTEVLEFLEPRYDKLMRTGLCERHKAGIKKNIKKLQGYIESHYPHCKKTARGAIDTKGITLDELLLINPTDEILGLFREIKDYEKVLTTYLSRLEDADPVIYSDYTSVVSSGRTSSSQSALYPSVNIQNQPRDVKGLTYNIRNCYVARPGYKLVSIDYAGLELAATAHQLFVIFQHSKMKDIINSGATPVDMHSKFACELKQCSYETFLEHKKEAEYARYRQLAKPINLGFPGGIGYKVMRELLLKDGVYTKYCILYESPNEAEVKHLRWILSLDCENIRIERKTANLYAVVYDELVGLKNKLFRLYPELQEFLRHRHTRYQTGKTKSIKNEFGEWETESMYRYNVLGTIRDWCTYTALCNGFLMQTPSAIGAKKAMYTVIKKYYGTASIIPLAFIHDEILFEVKDDAEKDQYVADVASILIDSMQEILTSVRITVEASMMTHWSKAGGEWERTYWKDPTNRELKML